jgi:hypothetical protein
MKKRRERADEKSLYTPRAGGSTGHEHELTCFTFGIQLQASEHTEHWIPLGCHHVMVYLSKCNVNETSHLNRIAHVQVCISYTASS